MKLPTIRAAAVVVFLSFPLCLCAAEKVELSGDVSAPGVEKTTTSKDVALVLPARFFRAKDQAQFSTPYIAELHYTLDDGKTWQSYRIFKDLDKPLTFTAETEGRYGFFVTLVDEKGNQDVIPDSNTKPQVTILFDWTPPEAELLTPAGGEVTGGGAASDIKWKASDSFMAEKPITIEYSGDNGASWEPIVKALDNSGTFAWMPPAGVVGRALVRVTAVDEVGHSTSAVTRSPVLIDTCPPTAMLLGPTLAAKEDVQLEVKTDDNDGSGVAQIELWSSLDNGATWSPAGKGAAAQTLVFHGTTGTYGLYATATDKAGNAGAPPAPGEAPQITVTIDSKTPIVRLKTLSSGGYVAGGSQTPIEWEAIAPNPAERPVSIYLSPDGGNSWSPVALDVANTGTIVWDVPKINSQNCLLKITFKDVSGALGSVESAKPFTIDSTKPTSAIGITPGAAQQPLVDLSKVVSSPACAPAAPVAPTAQGAGTPEMALESTEAQLPEVESSEPEAAGLQPVMPGPPEGLPEGARYSPETTPAPSAPWTGPKEEPNTMAPADNASVEDLMKSAFVAYKAGQLPIAKDYFKRAAALSPDDPRPHAALGRIYAREGNANYSSRKQAFEASLYEFEKAISLSGGDSDVYNDMGFVLLQSERYDSAIDAFHKATQIGSKPLYWYNLGLTYYKINDIDNAAAAFTKALEMDETMKDAAFYMGKISMAKGNWQDAKMYWTMAVDGYGPDSDMGKIALAGLESAREKLGEVQPEPENHSLQQKLDRIR